MKQFLQSSNSESEKKGIKKVTFLLSVNFVKIRPNFAGPKLWYENYDKFCTFVQYLYYIRIFEEYVQVTVQIL